MEAAGVVLPCNRQLHHEVRILALPISGNRVFRINGVTMAREIALKDEYFSNSDEATLKAVITALSKKFLLIPLDDYRIEINEMDYPAVIQALDDLKLNSPR